MELRFSLNKLSRNTPTVPKSKLPSGEILGTAIVPFKDMWETYNQFRQRGIFCDAILQVNSTKFPVHRAILAAHSSYFLALFTNGMKESMEDVITMEGLETDIMEVIINYIYTLKLPLNKQNIYGVFSHAECFCLNGICDICVDYLIANLQSDNCIECLKFAKVYNRTDLIAKCEHFLLQNFIDVVSRNPDFFISVDQFELCTLMSSNLLNVKQEEQVFRAAIQWINHDCESRSSYMDKFLRCMRLGLLSSDFFLEEAFSNFYIASNWNKVEDIADQAWNLINWSEKNNLVTPASRISLAHPLLRPRIPRNVLFAIGGWSGDSAIAFIETYDSKVDRWYSHPLLEDTVPRAYHAMVVHDSLIYLIGGFDGSYYFNSVKSFNAETGEWKELAPMYSQRCYVSGACKKGLLYACGGFDGRSRLNTVECYSVSTNQWRYIEPMHHQRSDASADILNGSLYIVGGFNGEHCLSSAECYSAATDQWTLIHRMSIARSGVSLIAHDGFVYALGGFDGSRRLNSCERYNPGTNEWEAMERMQSARSNFAVAVMDDCVYAIGGFDGSITIPHVEAYSVSDGEWSHVTDLNMNRSALKACVLDGLSNSFRYTFYGHHTDHGDASASPPLVSIFGYNSVEQLFAAADDETKNTEVRDKVGMKEEEEDMAEADVVGEEEGEEEERRASGTGSDARADANNNNNNNNRSCDSDDDIADDGGETNSDSDNNAENGDDDDDDDGEDDDEDGDDDDDDDDVNFETSGLNAVIGMDSDDDLSDVD